MRGGTPCGILSCCENIIAATDGYSLYVSCECIKFDIFLTECVNIFQSLGIISGQITPYLYFKAS